MDSELAIKPSANKAKYTHTHTQLNCCYANSTEQRLGTTTGPKYTLLLLSFCNIKMESSQNVIRISCMTFKKAV